MLILHRLIRLVNKSVEDQLRQGAPPFRHAGTTLRVAVSRKGRVLRTLRAAAVPLASLPLVVSFSQAPGGKRPEALLDLSSPEVRKRVESRVAWCGGVIAAQFPSAPKLPLRLEIKAVPPGPMKVGEELICDLAITNSGREPILLPWSPYQDVVYSEGCRWLPPGGRGLIADLRLELSDGDQRFEAIAAHRLYGASASALTLREVSPGETVTVRIWGRITVHHIAQLAKDQQLEFKLPREVSLTSSLDLSDSGMPSAYQRMLSTGQIKLLVTEQ
jgi:hypothetical protein